MVYAGLALINIFFMQALHFYSGRKGYYKTATGIWVGIFISFMADGLIEQKIGLVYHLFGIPFIFITTFCWAKLSKDIYGFSLNLEKFIIFFGCTWISGVFIHYVFAAPFVYSSMLICVGIVMPSIAAGYKLSKKWKKLNLVDHLFCLAGIIQGLHILDYPFLRIMEKAPIFGFSFGIFLTYIASILTPIVISQRLNDEGSEKLRTAKEAADLANKAKSQFLSNMSHEIRTPLNGILGLVDILKRSSLTDQQKEYLEIISESGDHLVSLISDILEISKIEAGKLEIENREFDLAECVEKTCGIMAQGVFKKQLAFPVYINAKIPKMVFGDEARIRQVLVNLIGNAIKFTPSGSISVELVTLESPQQGVINVRLIVEDTGIGIPQDKLKSIFDAFSQTDGSDTRKYGGSGLGLTITREIVESMGGSIEVESVEAQFSRFTIDIPFKITEEYQTQYLPSLSQSVVIALADKKYREFYARYILEAGGQLQFVMNWKEALRSIDQWPQEKEGVVLIERELIGVSYSEFLEQIEKNQNLSKWFFIVLVSLGDSLQFEIPSPIDNVVLLQKPLLRDHFFKFLQERKAIPKKTREQKVSGSESVSLSPTKLHVLLVEDNVTNQKVARLMLGSMGYTCDVAVNGSEGYEKLKKGSYQLILMDCQMPVMNGYESTRLIRQWEQEQDLQKHVIIAMTADAFRQTKEECFACGMDGFITKPVKTEELKETIYSVLAKNNKSVA